MTEKMICDLLILFIAAAVGALVGGSVCFVLGWNLALYGSIKPKKLKRRSRREISGKVLLFPNRRTGGR